MALAPFFPAGFFAAYLANSPGQGDLDLRASTLDNDDGKRRCW
ncbi:hypothetical protein [Desulfuromonas acetexigens]